MSERVLSFEGAFAVEAAKALGSEVRAQILELVGREPLTVSQLATELGIAQPAVTNHVRMLERAGLLSTYSGIGERGVTKLCKRSYDEIRLHLSKLPSSDNIERRVLSMPVGHYSRCEINPTCGMASEKALIGFMDDPRSFYLPERTEAGMLWFGSGFVEYDFANPILRGENVERLGVTIEICSEAPGYAEDYPSDITFSINGTEVGIWTSPGDMGKQPGALSPEWWAAEHGHTQHGFLKTINMTAEGTFIDGTRTSAVTPTDILSQKKPAITLRLEVKEDARYRGGLTIFGKSFGNYPQDISLAISTRKE